MDNMSLSAFDAIAEKVMDYVRHPPAGSDPVVNFASPEGLSAAFADAGVPFELDAPVSATAAEKLVDAVTLVLERSVHTAHPRFFNQNFAGPDPIAVAGDWLAAALNTTNATFEAAPVFTMMERAAINRLASMAGYVAGSADQGPPGLFCAGGSMAALFALQLARHRCTPDVIVRGAGADRLVLFVSKAAHYSALKSAALLGIGTDAVIEVETSADGAMIPAGLADALTAAGDRGEVPFAVIATAGTTVTSAFDPIDAIADVCDAYVPASKADGEFAPRPWLHVDGCWGGSALFSPSHCDRLHGVHRSDSMAWNLHKMLGMTQQCSVLLVKDPTRLRPVFSSQANYIFQPDKQYGEYDSGDRTFHCGRRVDVLKLWLAWKAHGDDGFARRIDHAFDLAEHTRQRIADSAGALQAVIPGEFTNVCFVWLPPGLRSTPADGLIGKDRDRLHRLAPLIKARMQRDGTAMLGYQPVSGLNAFRLLFMNSVVSIRDVDDVLDLIARYGEEEWAAMESPGASAP